MLVDNIPQELGAEKRAALSKEAGSRWSKVIKIQEKGDTVNDIIIYINGRKDHRIIEYALINNDNIYHIISRSIH
jgi:hypothetical protein